MTKNEKAIAMLESIDIQASIINDSVYIVIGETTLELSQFEIYFQAKRYDETKND
jgi:hypothetical protein